jgi:DNA-binding MarR family transcriptional regulator
MLPCVVTDEQRTIAEALSEVTRFVVRQTAALGETSLTAAATLSALASAGPRRLTDLAVSQGVSQPSMSVMIARLERQGMVERRRDPSDGRIVLVAITGAGHDLLRRRGSARAAFLSSLVGALAPADQQALASAAPALCHLIDPVAVPAALDAAKQAVSGEGPVGEGPVGEGSGGEGSGA